MKLKQICNCPVHYQHDGSGLLNHGQYYSGKVVRLEELVGGVVQNGECALVLAQFVEFGKMFTSHLSRRLGVDIPFIQGAVTLVQCEKVVAESNAPDGPSIVLLSTLVMGVGINLIATNYVIHIDR